LHNCLTARYAIIKMQLHIPDLTLMKSITSINVNSKFLITFIIQYYRTNIMSIILIVFVCTTHSTTMGKMSIWSMVYQRHWVYTSPARFFWPLQHIVRTVQQFIFATNRLKPVNYQKYILYRLAILAIWRTIARIRAKEFSSSSSFTSITSPTRKCILASISSSSNTSYET